jgi:hypothetical protein
VKSLLILLITALLAVVLLEAPRLLVEKLWKELIVFLGLWSVASFLAIAQLTGLALPNPTELINAIFTPK